MVELQTLSKKKPQSYYDYRFHLQSPSKKTIFFVYALMWHSQNSQGKSSTIQKFMLHLQLGIQIKQGFQF